MSRIFLLEGIATVLLAVGLYFVLPNRVDQCKWLNQEEKDAIWANRARGTEDDPLARKFEWRYLTECLTGLSLSSLASACSRTNGDRLQSVDSYLARHVLQHCRLCK